MERDLAPVIGRPVPRWPVASDLAWPGSDDALCADVDGLLRGSFEMLGAQWTAEQRTAWGWDPATGESWPDDAYTFDIDFRHGAAERDVKLAWELLRLQHLQLLAWAARGGDAAAQAAVMADLGDVLARNRPGRGIGYASGIEVAQRVASLLVICGLVEVPDSLRRPLWEALAAHGAWLERYPSLHSSANNHRVAELGGLFLLGCLAPGLPRARRWARDAAAELGREAARQIHSDGVGAEQSPTYQAFTMEWLLVCAVVGARTGHSLPPTVDDRLSAGARFLGTLLGPDGCHPRFGDEDEGVVLRCSLSAEAHVRSMVGAVACWLGRGALLPADWQPDARSVLLGLSAPSGGHAVRTSRHFPGGGYTWLRAGTTEADATEVLVDHGPLGFAWTAGHGHADALSVWVRRGGVPLVVDSGTYRYNGAPAWRRWMRGTPAHNTVTIGAQDQSEQSGPFNWGRRAEATLHEVELEARGGRVCASHDGYVPMGVVHRRTVALSADGHLEVVDELDGSGVHQVAMRWHLHPDCTVKDGVIERDGQVLGSLEVVGLDGPPAMARQSDSAGVGVHSPRYNVRQAATCLTWTARVELPSSFSTTFRFEDCVNSNQIEG